MNPINNLITLFHIDKQEVIDNLMNVECIKLIDSIYLPDIEDIKQCLDKFPNRDSVNIKLIDDIDSIISIDNKQKIEEDKYQEFRKVNIETESNVKISININKSLQNTKISIYSFQSFYRDLMSKDILEMMKFCSFHLQKNNRIIFVNYDNDKYFHTKTISMVTSDIDEEISDFDRDEILNNVKEISSFSNSIEYELIPEDFDILNSFIDNEFKRKFLIIRTLLSIIYISNYSSIDEYTLKVQLNGYRNNNYDIDLEKYIYEENHKEFFRIYMWVVSDGNIVDKIGIVRNIISMHCKYSSLLDIDDKTFSSIKSNYDLYLKDNVSKYIELKNALTEFVIKTSQEINNITLEFIDSLKKNIGAFITFILGTLIANIVSDNKLDNIFTNDILAICYLMLGGSMIYLLISLGELNFKFNRYKEDYKQLKTSYTDVLDTDDINHIFENDKTYKKNKEIVNRIKVKFTIMWIMVILVIGLGLTIYKNIDVVSLFKNLFLNIFNMLKQVVICK